MKIITFSPKTRIGSLLLALAILGAGVALVVVGFALLAGIAVAGTLLGAGAAVYYKLRRVGRSSLPPEAHPREALDPADEVFSEEPNALPKPPRAD